MVKQKTASVYTRKDQKAFLNVHTPGMGLRVTNRLRLAFCKKTRRLFLSFPYVCPEPVLVK